MNRAWAVIALIIVLICLACGAATVWLMFTQSEPVAQATPLPPTRVLPTLAPQTPGVRSAPTLVQTIVAPTVTGSSITVSANRFENKFRDKLLFDIEAQSSMSITQIALYVQVTGLCASGRQIPEFTPDIKVQTTYEWNLGRNYLPPGATGEYWWTIQDSSGNQLQTPKQAFRVDDLAHKWQKIENDKLALYWYAGGDSFGKALFDRGVEAMQFLQYDTGATPNRQVQIFIYANRSDFFKALEPGATEWTGGRAFSDHAIIVINVEPNALEWGKGATTHELTHQVIHQVIQDSCGAMGNLSMPRWLDEGLAMYYETYPGALDSQFDRPLKRAIQNDSLVALRTLVGAFPADSSAANLAYAQSYSVVDFIFRRYGREKMAQLLQEFKRGGFYDDVLKKVFNADSDALENEWRKDVGAKPRAIVTRPATTPTAFPTFSLSTDATPTPNK